jgi:hypothetical protein
MRLWAFRKRLTKMQRGGRNTADKERSGMQRMFDERFVYSIREQKAGNYKKYNYSVF